MVGVPDEDIGTVSNGGLINILYGRSVGLGSTGNQGLDQNSAGVPDAVETLDFFGGGLAAGDFNGDGVADLAVGVSREELPDQSTDHGAVSILFGQR